MDIYISGVHQNTDQNELKRIRALITKLGFRIILPEQQENINKSWADKMKFRLDHLQSCFAIYMVSTWRDSLIARVELTAAMTDKMQICFSPEDLTTLDN